MIPRVLVIAGSDSGAGAGIQADIKTVLALGGYATTAITAITAQNTLGVSAIHPIPPEMVLAQIDAVMADIGADAVKIGMIGGAATAEAVAERLRAPDMADLPVVFDPVMVATTGARLADAATALAFARLLTRATVSTPNLDELAALSGMPVETDAEIRAAARHLLRDRRAGAILVTGTMAGVPAKGDRHDQPILTDHLFDHAEQLDHAWSDRRIETDQDHGTGCTLASGIAVGLARGLPLADAISAARSFVRAALMAVPGLGRGRGPMGHGAAAIGRHAR